MRQLVKILGILLAVILLWLAVWMLMMRADVKRVDASIAYQNEAFRTANAYVNFKADKVYATGFPFAFKVAVARPTLSMVDGDESFSVSFANILLTPIDARQGVFRVEVPPEVEALYAKSGASPEHYFVTANAVPKLNLSAVKEGEACGPMRGKACADVPPDAPLISYAVGVPKSITLRMTLNGESRDAVFQLAPMEIAVPIYQPIPQDMSRPLEIFVRMLREALVYKTPGNEVEQL